ncbi:MAG: SpoIIE family protein phosphatase [Spirochaetales bacterium]|nr:SpoIIE family protein phosphatase [Spirochaetales bacterium]
MKIFVVDDSKTVCELMKLKLKEWGYEAEVYNDSLKGYYAMRNAVHPLLGIVDWEMPTISGVEICSKLKEEFPYAPMYLILLTVRSSKDDLAYAIDAGADDYVGKPFDDKELKSRIDAGIRILNLEQSFVEQKKMLANINRQLNHSIKVIEEDLEAAKKVQLNMLPQNNFKFRDLSIDYSYYPSAYLSGDFLDYFYLDDNYLIFYFADVAGHGVPSAFITTLLKSYVNSKIFEYQSGFSASILSPAKMLENLNENFIEQKIKKHLTIFYGIIDIAKNTLKYANAGHFPFPIISGSDGQKFLEQKNFIIGIMKKASFKEHYIELPSNYSVNVFSDGILDIMGDIPLEDKLNNLLGSLDGDIVSNDDVLSKNGVDFNQNNPDDITYLRISRS